VALGSSRGCVPLAVPTAGRLVGNAELAGTPLDGAEPLWRGGASKSDGDACVWDGGQREANTPCGK
jgi:hypothetical protein